MTKLLPHPQPSCECVHCRRDRTAAKVRENRLRRMAARQGLRLVKSRRRDPLALDYGKYALLDHHVDADIWPYHELTLDEVEHYLVDPTKGP